jgi:hypothetical protein
MQGLALENIPWGWTMQGMALEASPWGWTMKDLASKAVPIGTSHARSRVGSTFIKGWALGNARWGVRS